MSMKHLQIRPRQLLTGIIAVSFVVVFSSLLLFVANNPLRQSQDDRRQAAIPEENTIAEIKIVPAATTIKVGDQSNFIISGSTGGSDTYGFQFVALIDTTHIQDVSLVANTQANLVFPVATVTAKSATQSEIVIFATNPSITAPVNISGFQTLATLSFKAKSVGNITISPHDGNSKVLGFGSNANLDLLKPMTASSIRIDIDTVVCAQDVKACPNGGSVGRDSNNHCEFFACPAACTTELKTCPDGSQVGRDINNNCQFRACPTVCATDLKTCPDNSTVGRDPNNSCEFRACPTGGTGGYVVQGCDGSCSSNRECAVNLACYNGKCRLVTNVNSSTCQPAANTNGGSLSSCNQYCADSRECGTSLVCWYNQCRNPRNVESPTCAAPSIAQTQITASGCNQSCASNRDCATNLRCYYGFCRAAANPQSVSCNPVPATSPTPAPKPAKGQVNTNITSTATPSAITATPTPQPTATPTPIFDEPVDQSALGAVQQYLTNFWQTGKPTQVMLVLGLAVLMILGLVVLLFSLLSPRKPKLPPHRTPPPVMPPPTLTMQR